MIPNFLICGAPKCGSTSLYCYLKRHPQIFLIEEEKTGKLINNYNENKLNCPKTNGFKKTGWRTEIIYNSKSPLQIVNINSEAKLIFILRNPIERAYSSYWFWGYMEYQRMKESFSQVIRKKTHLGQLPYHITQGFYINYLKKFNLYFKKSQMHFIIFEDFVDNTQQELQKCFCFLGVEDNWQPDNLKKFNTTIYPVNLSLVKNVYKFWSQINKKNNLIKYNFTKMLKDKVHQRLFSQKNKPPMKQKDRVYLREIYREPNKQLADFLGRDLSFWE